jgi:tryptophan synthase alpha chain
MKMNNRIFKTFQRLQLARDKALVGFVTAGDPSLDRSLEIALAMAGAGLDVLELGVPFSDPTADGPVIQRASARALAAGIDLNAILGLVRALRRESEIPIVLFSYYNPIHAYGPAAFLRDAGASGADGLLVVDLPPEEAEELDGGGTLSRIRLVAPTTPPERVARIAARAAGFLYLVSRTGVTGSEGIDMNEVREQVARIRAASPLPVCVGFGISTPESAAASAAVADGGVVGSALVRIIEEHCDAPDLPERVAAKVRELKEAIRCAV